MLIKRLKVPFFLLFFWTLKKTTTEFRLNLINLHPCNNTCATTVPRQSGRARAPRDQLGAAQPPLLRLDVLQLLRLQPSPGNGGWTQGHNHVFFSFLSILTLSFDFSKRKVGLFVFSLFVNLLNFSFLLLLKFNFFRFVKKIATCNWMKLSFRRMCFETVSNDNRKLL